ncbi:MAG: AMP-binding protein [Alicyclobacillus sp.]|nr:AMP-binding protein [Alicyclobacillus sp.]
MNLAKLFEFAVGRGPARVALVDNGQSYTFLELDREVNRVASSLRKIGIGQRDRVMVLLKNRRQTVCLFWALQKLGAIFIPVNFHCSSADIAFCIHDVEPKAIIYEDFVYSRMPRTTMATQPVYISLEPNGGDVTYAELVENGSAEFDCSPGDDEDIALMLYTSGTSGVPKGVPRSHKNEYASTMAHIIQNRYEIFDSSLGAMPLYHTMGVHSLLAMTMLNGKFVSVPDFDSDLALAAIAQERVTCLYMIPTMYHELVTNRRLNEFDISSVEKIGYAGAPMSHALIQECQRVFKPKVFLNHYGSTEIYTFSTCPNVAEKPGCAGRPGINQNLRLISLTPHATPKDEVGKNEIGQVIVHMGSDEAFKGYWNRPEVTREVIHDNWFFTGDIGLLDDDGDLFIQGRTDELVISGVDHVSPLKVEEVLCKHEKVAEVAVTGEKDERWGQIVVAYVVPRDSNLTVLELDRFCKQSSHLSSFERPRKYIFVSELPKGPTGKILRRELTNKGEPVRG